MAEDPYSVLGVAKSATDDDIRKAYRKAAKQFHPDLNPGNAQAAERFKKVSAANDIIGDPEKRRRYDRGEIDASGEPRRGPQWHGGARGAQAGAGARGFDPFGDIFSDIFGGVGGAAGARTTRGPAFSSRGQDVRYTLEVDFLEAAAGEKKRVTMPDGGVLDITVPAGVADGQVLRLRGKGQPGIGGGEAGDALIEIKVRPHAVFKRQGLDVLIEVPITIDEAVLGAKIEVPTITGRVALTIPKATSSGRAFRLKGKGFKGPNGSVGDELVTVRIVLPETVDEGLAYFLAEWRQKHGYNSGRV